MVAVDIQVVCRITSRSAGAETLKGRASDPVGDDKAIDGRLLARGLRPCRTPKQKNGRPNRHHGCRSGRSPRFQHEPRRPHLSFSAGASAEICRFATSSIASALRSRSLAISSNSDKVRGQLMARVSARYRRLRL